MYDILNYLKKWTSFSREPTTTQVNPSHETTTPKTNATAKNKKKDRMHGSSGKKKKSHPTTQSHPVEISVDLPSHTTSQSQSRSDAAVPQVPKINQTTQSRSDAEKKLPKSNPKKFNVETINSYFDERNGKVEEEKNRNRRGGREGGRGGRGAVGKGEGASSSHRGGRGKNIISVVNKDPIFPGWTKPIVPPKPIGPPSKASKPKPSPLLLSGWTTPIVLPGPLGAPSKPKQRTRPIVPPGPIGPPSKVEKQHGSNTMFDLPYQQLLNLRPKPT